MKALNKFVLFAMDRSKTIEELTANYEASIAATKVANDAAKVAADNAIFVANNDSFHFLAAHDATVAAANSALHAANCLYATDASAFAAYDADAANYDSYVLWFKDYFTATGEDMKDYEKEIRIQKEKIAVTKDIEAKIKIELKAAKTAVDLIRITLAVTPENYSGKVLKQLESINDRLDDLRKKTDAREDG
mgnify:CR=1 FL=1